MRKVRRRRRGWTIVLVFLVGRATCCTPNIYEFVCTIPNLAKTDSTDNPDKHGTELSSEYRPQYMASPRATVQRCTLLPTTKTIIFCARVVGPLGICTMNDTVLFAR